MTSFSEDYHVHSTFSDDAESSIEENVDAARRVGLETICLVDHVRATTQWVPQLVEAVNAIRPSADLLVLVGVETKILNAAGDLDLPVGVEELDHILIADHQFPSEGGPMSPSVVREMLLSGEMDPTEVIEMLLEATVAAMGNVERPVIAHPFSLLPKVGLDESMISDAHVRHLAAGARANAALVEVNEKWNCPGPRLVASLAAAGVTMVTGSDAHHCEDVGRYDRVRANLAEATVPGSREPEKILTP